VNNSEMIYQALKPESNNTEKLECGCEIYTYKDKLKPCNKINWCDVHNKAFVALGCLPMEKERSFHEGKEFAILTISNAILNHSDMPMLALQTAIKALRGSTNG
jgi:hypothetical protein